MASRPSSSRKRQQAIVTKTEKNPYQSKDKELQSERQSPSLSAYGYYSQSLNPKQQNSAIEVDKSSILKLVEAYRQQNSHLSKQKAEIGKELEKLHRLSESITSENSNLQNLYFDRNSDLQKLLKTIEINLNEEICDNEHCIALSKQNNNLLVKQIEQYHCQIREKGETVQRLEGEKNEADSETLLITQEKLQQANARIESYFSAAKIKDMENELSKKTEVVHALEEEVVALEEDLRGLTLSNKSNLESFLKSENQNEENRKQLTYNIVYNLKTIQEITRENAQLKVDFSEQSKHNQTLKNRLQSLKHKLKEATQENVKIDFQRESSRAQIQSIKVSSQYMKLSKDEKEILRYERAEKLAAIQSAIEERKIRVRKMKAQHESSIESLKNSHQSEVHRIERQIHQQSESAQAEVRKYRQQQQRLEPVISASENEFEQISKDVESYSSMVKGLDNPASEVQRLQMLMKISDSRRPLGQLFGEGANMSQFFG